MNLKEYTGMVEHHYKVLNKRCEDHISDCLCKNCVIRSNSAKVIRENAPKFEVDKQAFIYHTVYNKDMNQEEELITCPYGYETCDQDDFESMCDGCREDRGEEWDNARMDTYD